MKNYKKIIAVIVGALVLFILGYFIFTAGQVNV